MIPQAENDVIERQSIGEQECFAEADNQRFKLRFAWETQQGTYASKPDWQNQDRLLVRKTSPNAFPLLCPLACCAI